MIKEACVESIEEAKQAQKQGDIATPTGNTTGLIKNCKVGDVLVEIGPDNMQNFVLLRDVGKTQKPVLLHRGPSATIDEWLMAAEYILAEEKDLVLLPDELSYTDGAQVACGFGTVYEGIEKIGSSFVEQVLWPVWRRRPLSPVLPFS